MLFADVDQRFCDENDLAPVDVFSVVEQMRPYVARWLERGGRLNSVTRHMLMLFYRQPGGRKWRRIIGEAIKPNADLSLLDDALDAVRRQRDDSSSI